MFYLGVQIVVEVLGAPLRITSYLFEDIAPFEIIFSNVGHCVCLSVSYNELMNPVRAGTFYGLSIAASLVPETGPGPSWASIILGVREKERMSE